MCSSPLCCALMDHLLLQHHHLRSIDTRRIRIIPISAPDSIAIASLHEGGRNRNHSEDRMSLLRKRTILTITTTCAPMDIGIEVERTRLWRRSSDDWISTTAVLIANWIIGIWTTTTTIIIIMILQTNPITDYSPPWSIRTILSIQWLSITINQIPLYPLLSSHQYSCNIKRDSVVMLPSSIPPLLLSSWDQRSTQNSASLSLESGSNTWDIASASMDDSHQSLAIDTASESGLPSWFF